MLIYLLQRVWFNGGFKREYCSVKILEYSIWIFKVAVKVFGGCFHSWSGESRWALAAWCHLEWGHLCLGQMAQGLQPGQAPEQAHVALKHEELEVLKGGVNAFPMLCWSRIWAHTKASDVSVSLRNGDRVGHEQAELTVLQSPRKGDICLFIFSIFTMLCLPLFWGNIFFLMGNHSESTNRTICPIVLKTKVLIIF